MRNVLNSTMGTVPSQASGAGDDFAAYDTLPPVLRFALQDMAQKGSAISILRLLYAGNPLERVLWAVQQTEEHEIQVFGLEYMRKYGHPYPFISAGGTVQRYRGYRTPRRRRAS